MARRARSSKSREDKAKPKAKRPLVEAVDEAASVKKATVSEVKGALKEKVGFSQWFIGNQGTLLLLAGIFLLALLLRTYFYYDISFAQWPPRVVGNDPSYHLRVIEYVQAEGHHLTIDELLNYPLSGGNPRPPIFDWSIAIMGVLLSPFFGFHVENATWFVFQFAPSVWGALTIFPAYLLGREMFGRKAGLIGAFLLAITASHIERSTLGFTDHDAFIVFFLVLGVYFMVRSFSKLEDRNYVGDYRRPDSVILGFRQFFRDNPQSIGFAVLAGLCITTIAMTWQGYAYILAILLIYYLVQLMIQRFRNEDSMGTFIILLIVMGIAPLLSFPYYFVFSIATWSQGFYILLGMVGLGLFIVPTRDVPWLIVIPTLALLGAVSFLVLNYTFPETANMLFTGGGYFVKSKLYSTIAEAQAPDLSRVIFTYGPATFFLGLIGVVMAVINLPKHLKKDYILVVIWTAVAIFMALQATRFTFNATPAFTLLAGWVLIEIVRYFKAEGLSIVYSIIALIVFFGMMGIIYEGWDDVFSKNFMAFTLLPIAILSVAYYAYMKYRKHKENFRFRTVLAALFVGFVVIFPNVIFAVDAGIPYETKQEYDRNLDVLGTFGSSFNSEYWVDSYEWLATQDLMIDGEETVPEDRPAFMSWWDYGFDQIVMGEHPTAADNFQNGYQFTGSMIASQSEQETIALMTARLIEGDWVEDGRGFSDEMWSVLVDHLGDDRNSTGSAYELQRIYSNPSRYIDRVESNPDIYGRYIDLTPQNALYAAAKVVLMKGDEEDSVALYHDVRDVTGRTLGYFAVDSRLFPFSSSNTGIFYAPIKLADRDINDYLEYKVYAQENTQGSNDDPKWVDYPDNPISMDKAEQESERLGYKFRIQRYDMFYTDAFYNSMFYRTYIGYSPEDVGTASDGKTIPGFGQGTVGNLPPMQGWNMTHWKLVYRTMYYSYKDEANASFPDDYEPMESSEAMDLYRENQGDVKSGLGQGVFYLRYYDGAVMKGRVRTEDGTPAPEIRVTALDDFGIPHGNVLTDEDGSYEIVLPPGEVTIVVSDGELSSMYDNLYQFQVDQSTGQPSLAMNITSVDVSDDQAMRRSDDWTIERDLIVPGKAIYGQVYWDLDDDGTYEADSDSLISRGNISFVRRTGDIEYDPVPVSEDGQYVIFDIVPGTYDIYMDDGSESISILSDFKVDPKTENNRDLKISNTVISGTVFLEGSLPAQVNTTVLLMDGERVVQETLTDPIGNFSFEQVIPGTYEVMVDDDKYIHEGIELKLVQGDSRSYNITLLKKGTLMLKAYSTITSGATIGKKAPASGAILYIHDHMNLSRYWTYDLDQRGEIELGLQEGYYDVHIVQIEKGRAQSYLTGAQVKWQSVTQLSYDLVPAYRVNGTVTKLAGTPLDGTTVQFMRPEGAVAIAIADNLGRYEVYLPVTDYKLIVDNTTVTGGVNYYHMQDLTDEMVQGGSQIDIWADQTIEVRGKVYWDKDMDGKLTLPEEADRINREGGRVASEVALAGLKVIFEYSNGSIEADTIEEGVYLANLPVAKYTMRVDARGFVPFRMPVDVADTVANRNLGINDTDAPLRSVPREFELNLSYPTTGYEQNLNRSAGPITVTLVAQELYMEGQEFVFIADEDGKVRESLLPAEYDVLVAYSETINGMVHDMSAQHFFFLEPGDGIWPEEVSIERSVVVQGVLSLVENGLVKYPPEVLITFTPVMGVGQTLTTALTDFNGGFMTRLPMGYYVVEAHDQRSSTHYMLFENLEVKEDSSPYQLRMVEAYPVRGELEPAFVGIQDSELVFNDGDSWTTTRLGTSGEFSTFLPEGEYVIFYRFITSENLGGESAEVHYIQESTLTVTGPVTDFRMALDRWVAIHGAVYHDISGDRTIEPDERKGFVRMEFISIPDGKVFNTTTDSEGDYRTLLPEDDYAIKVYLDNYQVDPRDGYRTIDLSTDEVLWDIQLDPEPNMIRPTIVDENSVPVKGMEFTIRDSQDSTVFFTDITDGSGSIELQVVPGIYNVIGLKYVDGLPIMGYVDRIDIGVGEDITGTWTATGAARYRGTVFYKDTDGAPHTDLSSDDGLVFKEKISRGEFLAPYIDGTYSIDLPYGEYEITGTETVVEYDMDITYIASHTVVLNGTTPATDLAFEFEKSKLFTLKADLINEWEHELMLSGGEKTILVYYIENTGNEPITVDLTAKESPEGWLVEFPYGSGIEIPINGRVERSMNITSPVSPDFSNRILIEASTDKNTRTTFEVNVKTPASYNFALQFDRSGIVGMDFDQQLVFNVSVLNLGSGEDVVNIRMSPDIGTLATWDIEWEGSDEFPASGENASVTPYGKRSYAVTVRSPEESVSRYGDRITLTFSGTNRLGDTKTGSVSFEVRKPNLILPPGFLKLTNRRLDDAILNKTLEANITVGSQFRAVSNVNVTLFVDGKEVAQGFVRSIPQDGYGFAKLRFNITDWNITEDEFHSFQVIVDGNKAFDETNEFDNIAGWDDVVIGYVHEKTYVNWRIVIFIAVILLVAVGIIAYKQRTEPI